MERFHPNFNYCDEMAPDPSGNWVSYEDAQARVAELESEAKACVEYDAALIDKITEERDGWHRAASAFQLAMDQVYAAKTLIDCHIIAQGILRPDINTHE